LNHVMLARKGEQLGGGRSSAASDFGLAAAPAAAGAGAGDMAGDDDW